MELPNTNIDINNEETLAYLDEILIYTEILKNLLNNLDNKDLPTIFDSDRYLQHAVIFSFKAIGVCVEKAMRSLNLHPNQAPGFWKDTYLLRHSLIHHMNSACLLKKSLNLLAKVCNNLAQIDTYFSVIVKNKQIDFDTFNLEILSDINALAQDLKNIYEKENRGNLAQVIYLRTLLNLTKYIADVTANFDLSEKGMEQLQQDNPKLYYALQNILELIATIANPKEGIRYLNQQTRNSINGTHADADRWLRELGDTRNEAMHETIIISNETFFSHLQNMLSFREEVLLNNEFQEKNALVVSSHSYSGKFKTSSKGNIVNNTNLLDQSLVESTAPSYKKIAPTSAAKQLSPAIVSAVPKGNNINNTNLPVQNLAVSMESTWANLFKSPLKTPPKGNNTNLSGQFPATLTAASPKKTIPTSGAKQPFPVIPPIAPKVGNINNTNVQNLSAPTENNTSSNLGRGFGKK